LELDDKAQTLNYEHYSPYGGTAIIAGKDKIQVQQKRYRWVWLGFCVLSLLLLLRMWVPMCRVLFCCFVSLVEMSNKGR
jgi:hypothetical protein